MGKNSKNQNKKITNKNKSLLNNKIQKDKIKPTQELDMLKFKQKINSEIENNPFPKMDIFINDNEQEKNYLSLYKKYINEELTPLCIVFINRIISKSKTLDLEIKNNNDLHKILLSLTKKLMMNEYELTIFSMILDEFGWSNFGFSTYDYLMFIGFFVKRLSGDDELIIFEYIKEQDNSINDKYINWKKIYNEKIKNHRNFTYSEVNDRFRLLKRPFNIYCKNNYIDYNNVVDKILKMSLPYNENKQKEEEDIISIDEEEKKNDNLNIKNINFKVKNVSNERSISSSSNNNKINKNLGKKIKKSTKERLQNNFNIVQDNNKLKEEMLNFNVNNFKSQNLSNGINMVNPYFQGFNYYSSPYDKKNDFSYNYLMPQNNQSQQSLTNIQVKNPSLLDVNLNNLNRKSLQNLETEEDNLRNLLNRSNNNFFQSGFSLNNVYDNNLDPFNLRSSSMFSNKFENYSEIKLNENNNISIQQNQNNHLSIDNVLRNNNKVLGVLNNNYAINYNNNNFSPVFQIPVNRNNISLNNDESNFHENEFPSSFTENQDNKDKKNLLGMYNQLKQKQLNKK